MAVQSPYYICLVSDCLSVGIEWHRASSSTVCKRVNRIANARAPPPYTTNPDVGGAVATSDVYDVEKRGSVREELIASDAKRQGETAFSPRLCQYESE